jgi:phage terminase small subunit
LKPLFSALVSFFVLLSISSAAPAQFPDHKRGRDPIEEKIKTDQAKAMNKDRVKEIQRDTNKLLDLATELKKSVDAAGDNTLSVEVIRKTDEIEKLAKKVRDKMKETYNAPDPSPFPDASRTH